MALVAGLQHAALLFEGVVLKLVAVCKLDLLLSLVRPLRGLHACASVSRHCRSCHHVKVRGRGRQVDETGRQRLVHKGPSLLVVAVFTLS